MEFFVAQINLILPVLGLDFTQSIPTLAVSSRTSASSPEHLFEMTAVGVKAEAFEADGEFVVLKGSQARTTGTASWTSYKGLRVKLLREGKLVEGGQTNILMFAENVAFDSPSAAAAVVYAGNQNGRTARRVAASASSAPARRRLERRSLVHLKWRQTGPASSDGAEVRFADRMTPRPATWNDCPGWLLRSPNAEELLHVRVLPIAASTIP